MKTFEERQNGFIEELTKIGSTVTVAKEYARGLFYEIYIAGLIDGKYFRVEFHNNTVTIVRNTDCKEKINELLIKHGLNDTERQN
mgnify:CR=1 FL=1